MVIKLHVNFLLTSMIANVKHRSFLQEIAYFDDHKHSVGVLTTRLATEASAVQGVSSKPVWECSSFSVTVMLSCTVYHIVPNRCTCATTQQQCMPTIYHCASEKIS